MFEEFKGNLNNLIETFANIWYEFLVEFERGIQNENWDCW